MTILFCYRFTFPLKSLKRQGKTVADGDRPGKGSSNWSILRFWRLKHMNYYVRAGMGLKRNSCVGCRSRFPLSSGKGTGQGGDGGW